LWPNDPVAIFIQGIFFVGWPSRLELIFLNVVSDLEFMIPVSENTPQRIGTACPFDRINSSFLSISSKNKVDIISAQLKQLVGWPEPAAVVAIIESTLSLSAINSSFVWSTTLF